MRSDIHSSEGSTLVVGVDSQIGRSLCHALQAAHRPALGTTRRPERVGNDMVFLDLSGPQGAEPPLAGIASAVLCAGITSIAACAQDPLETAKVNVDGTVRLAAALAKAGVHTIFLSSNAVFDGSQPFPNSSDETRPASEYGRQKREAEEQLSRLDGEICIIRFSKILPPRAALFQRWSAELLDGRAIEPTRDAFFAPLSLAFAVDVIVRVIAGRSPGVIQASANRDISYADAAARIASKLGVDPTLVRPKRAAELGLPFFPRHTTMDSSALRSLGAEPPDPFDAVDRLDLSAVAPVRMPVTVGLVGR